MTVGLRASLPFESQASDVVNGAADSARRQRDGATVTRTAWRDRPRWLRRTLVVMTLVLAAALVASPVWGPRALSRLDFFHVRTVEFDGVRFAKAAELVQRLRIDTTQSVWQSLDTLMARIAEHPMVRSAQVERDLPGTLRVHVIERVPVALVPSHGMLRPADATGALLPIDPAIVSLDIPVAFSADSALLAALDGLRENAPAIYARISASRRIGADELRFTLTGGSVGAAGPAMQNVLLVRTSADVTVARFKDILPVEADLARNHLRAVELDLRFRDQVIARQP